MNNIPDSYDLLYAGAKLLCDKIGVTNRTKTKNQNMYRKFDCKPR